MRDAARALDDVSDHLGEVLRHADQLLADWSAFGAQVRVSVDREVASIGAVVDGAVARAASAGLDQAVADRLRALTTELERLEQRARTASRAVASHRETDRRILWVAVAGIVLANALLVVVLLRRPVATPVAEPVRVEAAAPPAADPGPTPAPAVGSGPGASEPVGAAAASRPGQPGAAPAQGGTGSNTPGAGAEPGVSAGAGSSGPGAGSGGGSAARSSAASAPAVAPGSGTSPTAPSGAGPARPPVSPVSLPGKAGALRPHKKLP
jgi:hypothetical protein